MGKCWGVIGWLFGFACCNGDGRQSAEPPRKYSKYNQCANRTYRSYLSVACVQIERVVPQGMQCVTPSIDACLVIPQKTNPRAVKPPAKYSTSSPFCVPPAGKMGGKKIAEARRNCHPPMRLDHRHTHTAVNIPLPVVSVVALRLYRTRGAAEATCKKKPTSQIAESAIQKRRCLWFRASGRHL